MRPNKKKLTIRDVIIDDQLSEEAKTEAKAKKKNCKIGKK